MYCVYDLTQLELITKARELGLNLLNCTFKQEGYVNTFVQ